MCSNQQQHQQHQQQQQLHQQQQVRTLCESMQRGNMSAAASAEMGAGNQGNPRIFRISGDEEREDGRHETGASSMMREVVRTMRPRKAFEGKVEEWREWKEDLEEFWELHYPGAKAALRRLASQHSFEIVRVKENYMATHGSFLCS